MMVRQDTLPFVFNGARPSRFGVIDKRQPKGSREPAHVHHWFELEPMSIFHTLNAWQEGPLIRMYTCYTPQVSPCYLFSQCPPPHPTPPSPPGCRPDGPACTG